MSEFVVYRTLGNGRCLVLDGTRIAGGKPDYRGNNYITSWVTNKTYGPVDELKSENAKLRDWCGELLDMAESNDPDFLHWPEIHDELRKLGVKIDKL